MKQRNNAGRSPSGDITPMPGFYRGEVDADGRQAVDFDWKKYADFLKESDLSERQKQELLEAIGNVVFDFVSLGFNIHPLQQIDMNGDEIRKLLPADSCSMVSSRNSKIQKNIMKEEFVEASLKGRET